LVLGSIYILDRASIGMHGFVGTQCASALSFPAHVAAQYFNTNGASNNHYERLITRNHY
jgi:hypothetical protein